jgi:uncharacterized SAM-dependent methyltransferase
MDDLNIKLPLPGEGTATDYRRAGKAYGTEYAKRWIAIHIKADALGALTKDAAADFQRKAVADMTANVANLRTLGYAERHVVVFEKSMLENYKRTLSRFSEQPQKKPS